MRQRPRSLFDHLSAGVCAVEAHTHGDCNAVPGEVVATAGGWPSRLMPEVGSG